MCMKLLTLVIELMMSLTLKLLLWATYPPTTFKHHGGL